MGDISNWKSPIIGPKKKLIEDVDRADVIAKAKKFRVLKSPPSGSRTPMRIKVPKNIKSSKKPSKN